MVFPGDASGTAPPADSDDESNRKSEEKGWSNELGPQLIIGHTTERSARVWMRGTSRFRHLRVKVYREPKTDGADPVFREDFAVHPERDYIDVVEVRAREPQELEPNTAYRVELTYAKCRAGLPRFDKAPVVGRFRTFPEPDSRGEFTFLHGSCNLPIDRLTALGAMAAGLVGSEATNRTLEIPASEWEIRATASALPTWLKPFLRFSAGRKLIRTLLKKISRAPMLMLALTQFEQPREPKNPEKRKEWHPLLESPFKSILERPLSQPAFMIHCGDQMYHDLDFPPPLGSLRGYRHNYKQAWFKDGYAAGLLRSLPHYMILDDHEIVDGFGVEPVSPSDRRLQWFASRAYDDYVASRQPSPPNGRRGYYYQFRHGNTGFFVFDTRNERDAKKGQMISEEQLAAFQEWLEGGRDLDLRFVVSSVPFVAQLRPPGLDRNGKRRGDSQDDKWCGERWREQRDRILQMIYGVPDGADRPDTIQRKKRVERLIFLVGDMHCTYHARLQIGEPRNRMTIHELAGGPLNQLQFAEREDFYDRYVGELVLPAKVEEDLDGPKDEDEKKKWEEKKAREEQLEPTKIPWTSTIEAFHGASPSVLEISVTPESTTPGLKPAEVRWTAVRTSAAQADRVTQPDLPEPRDPNELCGRIRFHRRAKGGA